MFTLPHHCEFLSATWRKRCHETLSKNLKPVGAVSVSIAADHMPPHLVDERCWSFSWDGESLQTSAEHNCAADVVIEGDYQALLTLAQTVGIGAPGVAAEALGEVTHYFGDNTVAVGIQVDCAATRGALARSHDHMARQTVENPDIAHRAERLGLTGHIKDMEENGYTVIERAMSPTRADAVRAATIHTIRSQHGDYGTMQWMHYHGIEFEKLIQNAPLMTLIDASLGRGAVVASISGVLRGPGPGSIPLHTDYQQVPEPYPEFDLTGVGVWALEDWTESSGPTWLVPGSHRKRRGPRPDEKPTGVPIEMPKGSVVYFTHGVWHWQGNRTDPGDRVTIHSHFNRGILRSLEPKKVDLRMLNRNPPRLGEMLGEDDWYDKLTDTGRDYLRLRYMTQLNAFTDQQKAALLSS